MLFILAFAVHIIILLDLQKGKAVSCAQNGVFDPCQFFFFQRIGFQFRSEVGGEGEGVILWVRRTIKIKII